jgi:hypothetical protein
MNAETAPTSGPTRSSPPRIHPLAVQLLLLADRVQSADGPDRSLDWEIHLRNGLDGVGAYGAHPAYTASLDDAVKLVPRHHLWQVKQGIQSEAIVWMLERDYDESGAPTGYSTTFPAIALCAAAIRAEADRY